MNCSKCGSDKIMEDVTIVDFGHGNAKNDLSIHMQKDGNNFFKQFEKSKLLAKICGNCGNVELTVSNAEGLWEAYSKAKI